ncbi:MAG: hypothetical protein MUE30_11740, partial [Spirosomaceae bacterium]|nr:hypothetical protein [Spirosomataceae bacterium]
SEIDDKTDNPRQSQLEGQAERIKSDLRRQAEATFAVQRTSEGIEIKNILKYRLYLLSQPDTIPHQFASTGSVSSRTG